MFDADYPIRFCKMAEVMFHDTQLFFGGEHASYQELNTLPVPVDETEPAVLPATPSETESSLSQFQLE